MKKKTLVYIAPHLSTGGMPQYLFKQIESVINDFDVYCIEWDNVTGGVLVVQRNKIQNILGDRLITLGEPRENLFSILDRIKPDIIHLQEIPEMFMEEDIADHLYATNRPYAIIETSHDSSYDVTRKRYLPDKFLMVSNYQVNMYKDLGVPTELVEYPIEPKVRTKTREQALRDLGLDPNLKHVINVGLFTPRKNQAEVIEYARQLQNYPIQFHFIGNHADNFKQYWEPLMQNFPSNCKWWNERSDVDSFYEAADLFLFTSKGNSHDKETMPLVIREALSWKTPSLIYNLPVYMGYFDKFKSISYLTDSPNNNLLLIMNSLQLPHHTKQIIPTQDFAFTGRWDLSTQTMHYSCGQSVNFPVIVSVKEYKSNAVLWAFTADRLESNIQYWVTPIPKNLQSYEDDPYFTGVKLCIYNMETGEQLYEQPFFHKFVNIPTVTLSNYIPYRTNYKEFFVEGKFARATDKQYGLVVDIGANAGVFTEYMLQKGYAQHIIAVECDTIALADLVRNFKRDPQVTIVPKALHYKEEPIDFYQFSDNPTVSTTMTPEQIKHSTAGVSYDNVLTVDTISLGKLIEQYGVIDLIKIDIEGAEYDILFNAKDEWFQYINHLMIECHYHDETYKEKFYMLRDRLISLGYTVEGINPNVGGMDGVYEVLYAHRRTS